MLIPRCHVHLPDLNHLFLDIDYISVDSATYLMATFEVIHYAALTIFRDCRIMRNHLYEFAGII